MQIILDNPDESFTSVYGYYGKPFMQTYICSLTFKSNKRSYGPFGEEITFQPKSGLGLGHVLDLGLSFVFMVFTIYPGIQRMLAANFCYW